MRVCKLGEDVWYLTWLMEMIMIGCDLSYLERKRQAQSCCRSENLPKLVAATYFVEFADTCYVEVTVVAASCSVEVVVVAATYAGEFAETCAATYTYIMCRNLCCNLCLQNVPKLVVATCACRMF